MEGKHLVILCDLSFSDKIIATHALIDCGVTGVSFVDENFTRHHQLPLTALKYPRAIEVIDGRPISSGDITHTANVTLSIREHQKQLPRFVTKLSHYLIVLGIPWMELHDVAIRFSSRTLTFELQYCIAHCIRVPTVANGISSEPPEPALCSLVSKVAPCGSAKSRLNGARPDVRIKLELNGAGPGLDARTGLELNGARPGLDAHTGPKLNGA